ncbi:hypothetical protein LOK46_29615 [Methylobacterium sp. NMS14P]|nr:hypothetical protein [Methylobacterium sp. NMS14P]WCS25225.1 hypothetical protein LOK46_29615 [Methylobacterium sp. NMS14P]
MPERQGASPVEPWTPTEADTVALAYLRAAGGDRWTALVQLAEDALSDLGAADARLRDQGQRISNGYVRGAV